MAYISEIRAFKRGSTVEIIADGQLLARVRKQDFAKLPTQVGEELDEAEYLDRIAAIQAADAYECALTALDRAAKTENELRKRLAFKGFVQPAVDAAIERLTQARLIDDERIAARLAESAGSKLMGVYALKRKLKARGISEEDAEGALDALDDEAQAEACQKLATKLAKKYEDLAPREKNAKLAQALARRGFAWDAIHTAMSRIAEEDAFTD